MNIVIKKVECTETKFLAYYKQEGNITLDSNLYQQDSGFPVGFIAIEEQTNRVLGAGMLIDQEMYAQMSEIYDTKKTDTNPWMVGLLVNESNRNKGIGKKIVDVMINYCNELGYHKLNLNTETAKNFYEKYWEMECLSSYTITNDKKEEQLTYTFSIDIKKNLLNKNNIVKKTNMKKNNQSILV